METIQDMDIKHEEEKVAASVRFFKNELEIRYSELAEPEDFFSIERQIIQDQLHILSQSYLTDYLLEILVTKKMSALDACDYLLRDIKNAFMGEKASYIRQRGTDFFNVISGVKLWLERLFCKSFIDFKSPDFVY